MLRFDLSDREKLVHLLVVVLFVYIFLPHSSRNRCWGSVGTGGKAKIKNENKKYKYI